MRLLLDRTGQATEEPYEMLTFPDPPAGRPTIVVNMVCTLDGRTVNDGTARGLGSRVDRVLMDRIRAATDAILIGGGTLRADNKIRVPAGMLHAVLSESGDLPYDARFFADEPERALIFATRPLAPPIPVEVVVLRDADTPGAVARWLKEHRGVRVLLVEGGPTLNGQLFEAGIVDELFLTLTPKLRGGDGPTILTARPFPPLELPLLDLASVYEDDGELYLRYRAR
jgi:2,5-diamino-6-(ribosylamino)-4(3H)-pyrimidinone 5'-phosphate reductase